MSETAQTHTQTLSPHTHVKESSHTHTRWDGVMDVEIMFPFETLELLQRLWMSNHWLSIHARLHSCITHHHTSVINTSLSTSSHPRCTSWD